MEQGIDFRGNLTLIREILEFSLELIELFPEGFLLMLGMANYTLSPASTAIMEESRARRSGRGSAWYRFHRLLWTEDHYLESGQGLYLKYAQPACQDGLQKQIRM